MSWRNRVREWNIAWLGAPRRDVRHEFLVKRCDLAESERDYFRALVHRQHETIERLAGSAQDMSKEMIRLAQVRNPAHETGDIEDPPTRDQADRMAAIALRDKAIPPVPGLERADDAD